MAFGYFLLLADAQDYFDDERLDSSAWDALTSTLQERALVHAYNRIYYHPAYTLPDLAHATPAELVILRKANAEMAYYLCVHLLGGDEDRRKGIQAQGVVRAGIVEETYKEDWLKEIPIPAPVEDLLAPFSVDAHRVFPANLERDEDESVTKKVHDF
jgi:hypothetical protein